MYDGMVFSQPFCAEILVPADERGQLVIERVASHDQIYILHEAPQTNNCKLRYRQTIVDLLRSTPTGSDNIGQLMEKFVRLAESLESTKAIALPFRDRDNTLATKWSDKIKSINSSKPALMDPTELLQCKQIEACLLHPLVIALLAYQMGGAINAANTLHSHQWKSAEGSVPELAHFYAEGDTKNIVDDHRITLVWEERGGRSTAVPGKHHIFTENQAKPQPLTPFLWIGEDGSACPMVIVYDSRNTALWYECQDTEAVRINIGLDFHVNTITDTELDLLSGVSQGARGPNELTLTRLITGFPMCQNYTWHFNRLLFDTSSCEMILLALESLEVPHGDPSSPPEPSKSQLYQRFECWDADNLAHIPDFIREFPFNYPVSGVYETPASFINSLSYRMQQDAHFFIGVDLMPQTVADTEREHARKVIRGHTEEKTSQKLAMYMQSLTIDQYDRGSLLPPAQLQAFAGRIKATYLDLAARGYTDGSFMLVSLSSLSSALGRALNGPKEIDVTPKVRVTDEDLQIFRTRCLYLFWCADCLVRYLAKLREGPFMINRLTQEEMSYIWPETLHMTELLLRNWVAWGLFVETLPTGGFTVVITAKPEWPGKETQD
jgi:hypothetical protein